VALTRTNSNSFFSAADYLLKQEQRHTEDTSENEEMPDKTCSTYINELPENAKTVSVLRQEQKHEFSPEETVRIVVDYTVNHLTVYELAAKYSCHRTTISKHLKQNGVKVTHCKMDNRQIEEAIRLYESGLSLKNVGKLLTIAETTIRETLIRAGITMRPARRITKKGQ
jgi:predicted DNA-binding protein (UPF0251 family)